MHCKHPKSWNLESIYHQLVHFYTCPETLGVYRWETCQHMRVEVFSGRPPQKPNQIHCLACIGAKCRRDQKHWYLSFPKIIKRCKMILIKLINMVDDFLKITLPAILHFVLMHWRRAQISDLYSGSTKGRCHPY